MGKNGCEYVGSGQCENQVSDFEIDIFQSTNSFGLLPEQGEERLNSQIRHLGLYVFVVITVLLLTSLFFIPLPHISSINELCQRVFSKVK